MAVILAAVEGPTTNLPVFCWFLLLMAQEALIRTVPLFDSQPDVWRLSVIRRWLFLVFSPQSLTLSLRTPPTPPIMVGLGGILEEP